MNGAEHPEYTYLKRRDVQPGDIPEGFRPPKMWPTVLLASLTFILSIYATSISYKSDHTVSNVTQKVDENTSVRCETQKARLRIAPETEMERYQRQLAKATYTRGCTDLKN